MKYLLLLFILAISCFSFGQRETQIGPRIKFINNNKFHKSVSSSYPEFYTHRDLTVNVPAFSINGRTSTTLNFDSTKFKIKHTFEVGISKSRLKNKTTYVPQVSIWEQDTVGYISESYSKITQLEISNYIDFCFQLSDKFTLINALGFKIETPISGKKINNSKAYILNGEIPPDNKSHKRKNYTYSYDGTASKFPLILKLTYSPQLLIHKKNLSFNIHILQDIFTLNSLHQKLNKKFSNSPRYTSLGIFFILHKKTKSDETELLKDDFDY